jgi:hypothetical protein
MKTIERILALFALVGIIFMIVAVVALCWFFWTINIFFGSVFTGLIVLAISAFGFEVLDRLAEKKEK